MKTKNYNNFKKAIKFDLEVCIQPILDNEDFGNWRTIIINNCNSEEEAIEEALKFIKADPRYSCIEDIDFRVEYVDCAY